MIKLRRQNSSIPTFPPSPAIQSEEGRYLVLYLSLCDQLSRMKAQVVRLSGNGDKVLAFAIKFVPLYPTEMEMEMELINVADSGSSGSDQVSFSPSSFGSG